MKQKVFFDQFDQIKGNKRVYSSWTKLGFPTDRLKALSQLAGDANKAMDEVATLSLLEEYGLAKTGNRVVFFESESFVDNIIKAKYSANATSRIHLPFDSFSIAMPSGYKIDGVNIPPFIVTNASANERIANLYGDVVEANKMTITFDDVESMDSKILSFSFFTKDGATIRTTIREEQIPQALEAKDGPEFSKLVGDISLPMFNTLDSEKETQFKILKLIIGLAVYHSAVGGLRAGFPSTTRFTPPVGMTRIDYSGSTFEDKFKKSRRNKTASFVEPHYRNLRNELYYKGEFSHLPPGSRWVLVSEHMRGVDHVSPFTQQ